MTCGKGSQSHSNHSLQLLDLKKQKLCISKELPHSLYSLTRYGDLRTTAVAEKAVKAVYNVYLVVVYMHIVLFCSDSLAHQQYIHKSIVLFVVAGHCNKK